MHGEERPFLAPVIDLFNFGQALRPPPPPPPLPTPHPAPPRPPRSTPPTHPHAPASYALRLQQVGIRASYDDKRQGFAGKTVQPIKAGEELLFYYGNFCIDDAINMCGVAPPLYFPFSPSHSPTSHYILLHPTTSLSSPYFPSHTLTGTASRPRARRCARRRAPPRSKPADSPRASHGPRARVLPRALSAINRLQAPRGASAGLRGGSSAGRALRLPEAAARRHASAQDRGPTGRWLSVARCVDHDAALRAITVCAARTGRSRRTRRAELACAAGAREKRILNHVVAQLYITQRERRAPGLPTIPAGARARRNGISSVERGACHPLRLSATLPGRTYPIVGYSRIRL